MQPAPGTISPDGAWYWNGLRRETTLSPDGRWRWDGAGWRPLGPDIHLVDLPAAGHKTVRGVLVGGVVFALLVAAIGIIAAVGDLNGDGPYIAVLGFILVLVQGVALLLLVTGRGWRRVMDRREPDARLSLVLSLLLLGLLAITLFVAMLVSGGAAQLSSVGAGDVRELILVVLLAGAPGGAFIRLTTGGWAWVLNAPVRAQIAAPVLLGLAVLVGMGLVALAILLAATATAEDRIYGFGIVLLLAITLVLPVIGGAGLALGREFGRIAATAACVQWALTGVGLLIAVPVLWLAWRRVPAVELAASPVSLPSEWSPASQSPPG
jgi:hypothetical protein